MQLIHGRHFGGGEKVVLQLASRLKPPEFACEVICLSEGRLLNFLHEAGVKAHLLPMRGKLDFSILWKMGTILKKSRTQIIHSHTGRTNFLARLVSLFIPVRKLATLHSPVLLDTNINLRRRRLNALVERLTARWSDFFVAVSAEGHQSLLQQGVPAEKVSVVYNGVDLKTLTRISSEERRELRRELGFSAEDLIVAVVAQLRPRKGVEFFIQAMPLVYKAVRQSKFIIVGDANFVEGRDYLGELKQLAEKVSGKDLVKFTGFRQDADKIMELVDVMVLPSLFGEGLPLVLLEGMAHNLPIVATDTAGNKEVVVDGETGYLVPPANVAALAERIIYLLGSADLRKKMGSAGRRRAEEIFSLETMIEKYKAIYRQLVKNP